MKIKSLLCFSIGLLSVFIVIAQVKEDFEEDNISVKSECIEISSVWRVNNFFQLQNTITGNNELITSANFFQFHLIEDNLVRPYFSDTIPSSYELVINEMMLDPIPIVGLPNLEWIELKNTTKHVIYLKGCRIGDASGQSVQPFLLLVFPLLIIFLVNLF